MRDYYYILGVDENASQQEIKTAYRRLSLKFHPDKNNGEKFFEERFKDIQEAYETLSNPTKKNDYDYRLKQFKTNTINEENLRNLEQELRRKFEEEFDKREEELKRIYLARENKLKEEFAENARDHLSKNDSNSISAGSRSKLALFVSLAIALVIIFFLVMNIPKDRTSALVGTTPNTNQAKSPVQLAPTIPSDSSGKDLINENDIILIYDDNRRATLATFPVDSLLVDDVSNYRDRDYELIDMDGDGVPELLTSYFTGGAHCCSAYDFFQRTSTNTYKRLFSFVGGGAEIIEDHLMVYFDQQLGYFYTSYASNIGEELPNGRIDAHARLVYKNRTLDIAEKDVHLDELIFANLEFLKNRGVPELDSSGYDDGTRKSYAEHIITYFFNNDLNLEATHSVFQKYYAAPDSSQVWQGICEHLDGIWDMEYTTGEYVKKTEAFRNKLR